MKPNMESFNTNKYPTLYNLYLSMSKEVNSKLTARGIAKGMICAREDFNRLVLESLDNLKDGYDENEDIKTKILYLNKCKYILGHIRLRCDYLLENKALTPGEIGVLCVIANDINKQLDLWINSLEKS